MPGGRRRENKTRELHYYFVLQIQVMDELWVSVRLLKGFVENLLKSLIRPFYIARNAA